MSGQATAAAPAVRASGAAAPSRPLIAPPRPRRVSGPARRGIEESPARRRSPDEAGIAVHLLAALHRLSSHRALGGRTWIGLVAFALIGIVTLQLGLLKLNASIGRALEHEAVLQRENAALSIENSEMATSPRVTSSAAQLGMEPVPMRALRFLQARPRLDLARGAAALTAAAHAPAAGAEAPGGGSSAATSASASSTPAEQSASPSATTSTSTGPSSGGSAQSSGESSPAAPAPASSAGESSGRASEGPATPSGESGNASAAAPSASEGAGSSSTEGAPGGGTRASPSG